MERALRGEGPTLIESVTFRYGAHTTADDPRKYRSQEAISQEWREKRDPLNRLKKLVIYKGIWSEEIEKQWEQQINEEIESAFEKAANYPKTNPLEMFNHVYADKPWNIKEQQDELSTFLHKDVN